MIAELYSQIAAGLILASATQAMIGWLGKTRLSWLPIVVACLGFVPMAGITVSRWIYSFTGPISLPLTVLLGWAILRPLWSQKPINKQLLVSYWTITAIISVLYLPTSLGWTSFDPHAWGWSRTFIFVPCSIAVVCLWLGQARLAMAFVAAAVAWKLNLLDSSNGWNYLIDPISVCICGFSLISAAVAAWLSKHRQPTAEVKSNESSKTQTLAA